MKKVLIVLATLSALCSCGTTSSLYYWGDDAGGQSTYEQCFYKMAKTQSPQSICNLVAAYENIIRNPKGTRQLPPPGVCGEYGYLLLQPHTAEIFATNATAAQKKLFEGDDFILIFRQRGEEMLKAEFTNYPESERFIRPLLEKMRQ